ncbi:MAG: hypothetical protein WD275_03955 [Rhodothermales bacterium]
MNLQAPSIKSMEAHARAGIDIYDRVLRYAEIEQYGTRYRLLRLGSCDFDFDVGKDVLFGRHGDRLSTVADALRDVFTGSVAANLQVAVHPPRCYTFFSPLPAGSPAPDRKLRLQQEAALLAGTDQHLHITADAVHTQSLLSGDNVDWVHVLAVEDRFQKRVNTIVKDLPHARSRMMVGMQAAAATISRLPKSSVHGRGSFALGIGLYAEHVEYLLCEEGKWYYSKFTEAVPPPDVTYFAVEMLDRLRLRPEQVGRILLYGNDVDPYSFTDLETVFDLEAEKLDPLAALDLDAGSIAPDFDAEAYTACIGASL